MQIQINPDKEFVKEIRQKIYENDGHCICALERSENTLCPCKDFLEQKHDGWCKCLLYYKSHIEGE